MRRKKLLRQVAAAAVALSMAVSLSAPAFAAEFNLANGGLVIKADESGITVTQGNGAASTIGKDDEIVITGTYNSAGGAMQTAEENQQEENQPVTPAKAPAKEETPKETPEAEDAPAAEKKQEQKDTEAPADPEQNTETENKDNHRDPADEEKKEQNAPANGELNASAGEGQEPKAEDEGQPKPEAKASAEATASASDDASNGPRKAPARSSGEGEHRGIIQIFANTLVKLKLKDATIDQPHAADTNTRGMAAIDIQGSGNVEIKVEGNNTLNGYGNSAGIQKNDDVSTGKLTITAEDKDQTLNVNADVRGAAIGNGGTAGWSNTGTVQKGENQFTTDKGSIQDGAKVEMTNIGHNSSNTVTKTRRNGDWVTEGDEEQTPEECKHQKGSYYIYEETVFPNCTEKGYRYYRCRSCGEVVNTVELPVNNNHLYGETVTVKPTCTEKGYQVYKCSRCHQEYGSHFSFVNALDHQYVETTVAPTCTESGYTVQKCTRCHEEEGERTNLVAPLGHEYKNGVCIRCGAPEPQENGSAAPNYTVTGAETYETSVADGRYIIAVPSEDAALNAVLGDLRAIKAQGADVVVFRTRSRESSLVIDEMLAMGTDVTPFVLAHNGGEARLTINGAAHNELIH